MCNKILHGGIGEKEMQDFSSWAEHLQHPLVLIGFVVMLFAGIVHALLKGKEGYSEGLIKKSLLYIFVLSIIVIVLGFVIAYKKGLQHAEVGKKIIQKSKGGQSPTIVTEGKDSQVNITYGDPSKEEGDKSKTAGNDEEKEEADAQSSRHIEQKTEGTQSPAVVSDGDVTIKFESDKQ